MCQRSVDKTYHASLADVAIEAQTYAYYAWAFGYPFGFGSFPGYRVYSGRRLRTIRVFLKFGSVSVRVRVDSVRVRFGFFRVVKWRTHSDNSKSRVRVRFGYFSGFSVRVFGSGYYAQAYLKHICTSLWRTF
ncbi:unnamed protein product [Arabidopsis thaliana]|uniref:Transmembrane protein n=2 Tax=Arabidopsis thaliana TaxID=3702 RepID=Q9SIN8_ARATH|nr:uncharacterized protein AT2G31700 [Arabidopsis thaliana]AAD24846.1 hypothetical protein [Arabidopsis thaliana]AEC08574.1 transmembrane protein [Arabidopsis thaliana]CAA0373936.1 unnamed protein product [Arabidopsis thaliana]VYS54129.1 unnamed protein product [Arabidopsis thaliana]|eukprot:NP_180728.1 transmembrane protein [Arabidopsis thaliana]